jgi:hypothetical protein
MTRYARRGSYPSARSVAGRSTSSGSLSWWRREPDAPSSALGCGAARGELPDDSCIAHRPTRVDGHLAALHRARPEAKKRSCALCPGMM